MKDLALITLYVMGPMTFRKDSDFNYPAFNAAKRLLRQAGYNVLCPTEVDEEQDSEEPPLPENAKAWDWYMRRTIRQLTHANGIAALTSDLTPLLNSDGVQVETYLAHKLKIPIRPVAEWVSMALKAREEIRTINA